MDLIELFRQSFPSPCFSDTEIGSLIHGSNDRRYGLVKRALARGDLIHVRRGLYCLAEKYRNKPLNLFELAQRLYGPSYISFESALSYHGWIPEAVFTVTSASSKRSREFKTPLGVFSYLSISVNPFFEGVDLHRSDTGTFLIATPWKAICDYVSAYKKDWTRMDPLIQSLRIEKEFLSPIPVKELRRLEETYQSRRISKFVKGLIQ